jgi:hypothetical protein
VGLIVVSGDEEELAPDAYAAAVCERVRDEAERLAAVQADIDDMAEADASDDTDLAELGEALDDLEVATDGISEFDDAELRAAFEADETCQAVDDAIG